MDGGDYVLKLTANGLVGGSKKTVLYQSDGDIETGSGISRTPYKQDYSYSAHTEGGFQITTKILLEAPLGEGAQLMMDAYANKAEAYFYYEAAAVGSQYWHGKCKITMTSAPGPVSGPFEGTFILSQSGLINQAVQT